MENILRKESEIVDSLAAPLRHREFWHCKLCGENYVNPLAHSYTFSQPGPSAPILEGKAAEEFLKTIKQNENKKVPKELYDRAKENYKRLKII